MISKRQHSYLPSNLLSLGVVQQSHRQLPALIGFTEAGRFGRPLAVRPCSRGTQHLIGQQRRGHWRERVNTGWIPQAACFLKSEPTVFSLKRFCGFFLVANWGWRVCLLLGVSREGQKHRSVHVSVYVGPVARGTARGIVRIIFSLPPYQTCAITGPPKANGTSITSAPVWAATGSTGAPVAIQ